MVVKRQISCLALSFDDDLSLIPCLPAREFLAIEGGDDYIGFRVIELW